MVGNVTRRIIAAVRNRQFFSLGEVNQAIREEMIKLIQRPFQKMQGNRLNAFERIDKPYLQALPKHRYELADFKEAKIQFHYHVEYAGYFYSVYYAYAGINCMVRATQTIIEIFLGTERIAAHKRNYNPNKRYTTLPDHMPENHRAVSEWNSDRFIAWAEKVGPNTRKLIEYILDSREYPVQTYRTCMGIMRLAGGYAPEIMECASLEAIHKKIWSYKYFAVILKQLAKGAQDQHLPERIIKHNNVRGKNAYKGGGILVQ